MERNDCKHTRLMMEKKNNNQFVYESYPSEIKHMLPLITLRSIEKPSTLISWCADCGIKYKEVEQKNEYIK